ncbi:reverse transcriptase domain, reverse transcriptase zinc-binding domain protein [Tanacetum coccineum]
MRKNLKTHDMMRQWDVGDLVDISTLQCSLCNRELDSHSHLFFECGYSKHVWILIMQNLAPRMDDIVAWMEPIANQNSIKSIVARLVLTATTYFIWQAENNRIHGKEARRAAQLHVLFTEMVRMKLMTIRFKKRANVALVLRTWKIATGDFIDST